MANLNKVLLIGRLTRDPEMRNLPSGTAVVSFGLAVNRSYTNKNTNERVEETCFVDVDAWGKTGEVIARFMKKGRQIFIEGRLKLDTWEREGQKHSKLKIVAEGFQFIDGDGRDGGGGGERSERPARAGSAAAGRAAPVGARETPQDDYEEDIPF